MSTDRELLELAAKANNNAKIRWNGAIWCNYERMSKPDARGNSYPSEWTPFTDDGDALRLAVKLRADIYLDASSVMVVAEGGERLSETFDGALSPDEATRRAIVGVAASIGEAMP